MGGMTIEGRPIGPDEPVFVIAEIGVNHDGSVARAVELVEIAAECGADAVKLQLFKAGSLMNPAGEMAEYQRRRLGGGSAVEMLRRYELSADAAERICNAVWGRGMVPLATPFSLEDVDLVDSLGLPAVKIASPDLVNKPLLMKAAMLRKPLLVSTGASTVEEIDRAAAWLDGWRSSYALLHCVSSYPVSNADAHLAWIGELVGRFACPVGYSDHTTELISGVMAVGAGACVIEKHLTYDRSAEGPDHAASADAAMFERYVAMIRTAQELRGRRGRRVLAAEEDVRRLSRQSVVVLRRLNPGDVLRRDDVTIQRPGTGIPAADLERVLGRTIARPVSAGEVLQWDMLLALSDAA